MKNRALHRARRFYELPLRHDEVVRETRTGYAGGTGQPLSMEPRCLRWYSAHSPGSSLATASRSGPPAARTHPVPPPWWSCSPHNGCSP
jgi:hypothetical protein